MGIRTIMFRGKRADNGKWVVGLPYEVDDLIDCIRVKEKIQDIIYYATYKIIPETVGQYTGLTDKTDKNGNKIFEGDIVQSIELGLIGVVIFDEYCRFMIRDITTNSTYLTARNNEDIAVIGNIHDNPELLKGE